MLPASEAADQLRSFEKIMDDYYRRDPVESANQASNRAVQGYNVWSETTARELESERASLDAGLAPITRIEEEVAALDRELEQASPDARDARSVESYNTLVARRNALVKRHRELGPALQAAQMAFNERVRSRNEEMQRLRTQVDQANAEAESQVNAYNQWLRNRGPEQFFCELNRLYALLHRESRISAGRRAELQPYLEHARQLRAELGAYARKREEEAENGALIVEATLAPGEKCHLFVDTAASAVSLSPELAEALDLTGRLGDEVEVAVAGGLRVTARQLVLPAVSVQGMEAEYVKALVMKESHPGVDGCLGLSFLNRFDFRITGAPARLSLAPRRETAGPGQFDVFICHKGEDLASAKPVYDLLAASGYRPFLSEVSLPRCGTSDFQKAIDAALETARHLVVIASSAASVQSPWVESEWRLFVGMLRSGVKRGNVVIVLCGGMRVASLPVTLSVYQAIPITDPNWETVLLNYLPK